MISVPHILFGSVVFIFPVCWYGLTRCRFLCPSNKLDSFSILRKRSLPTFIPLSSSSLTFNFLYPSLKKIGSLRYSFASTRTTSSDTFGLGPLFTLSVFFSLLSYQLPTLTPISLRTFRTGNFSVSISSLASSFLACRLRDSFFLKCQLL